MRLKLTQKPAMRYRMVTVLSLIVIFSASFLYFNVGTPDTSVAGVATPIPLSFNSVTHTTGTPGAVNSVSKFSEVTTGVDAWVKLNSANNGGAMSSIDIVSATAGYEGAFQPKVTIASGTSGSPKSSYLEWEISFKIAGTGKDTTLSSVAATAIDIDGNSNLQEWIEAFNVSSYATYSSSSLTLTTTASSVKAVAGTTDYSGIDSTNKAAMIQINWNNVSSIRYRTGGDSRTSSSDRQFSIYFMSFFNTTSPLPIQLVKFEAKPEGKKVKVKWATASEKDNDFFTLERSTDNVNYSTIAKIKGVGNSVQLEEYVYVDDKPLTGNSYYRLKQTDFNGKSETFTPVRVSMNNDKGSTSELKIVSSNPFTNYIAVSYNADVAEEVQLKLFNSSGNELKSASYFAEEGSNTYTLDNLDELTPGIYFVSISNGRIKTSAVKMVKR